MRNTMEKTMKRITAKAGFLLLALVMMTLAACGKSEFTVTENTENRMVITAENAAKDAFFMIGSLSADEGDMIAISSGIARGEIKVEIIPSSGEQSSEVLPEIDGEALITAIIGSGDGVSGTVPAGTYYVRATVLEKATGTVTIEVLPAE